jgi:hypothetical protein
VPEKRPVDKNLTQAFTVKGFANFRPAERWAPLSLFIPRFWEFPEILGSRYFLNAARNQQKKKSLNYSLQKLNPGTCPG